MTAYACALATPGRCADDVIMRVCRLVAVFHPRWQLLASWCAMSCRHPPGWCRSCRVLHQLLACQAQTAGHSPTATLGHLYGQPSPRCAKTDSTCFTCVLCANC